MTTNPPTTGYQELTEAELDETRRSLIAAEVLGVRDNPDAALEAARGYFRLRQALYLAMGDMSPWVQPGASIDEMRGRGYPVDPTGVEVAELLRFIEHTTLLASHGLCDYCNRTIYAPDPYVHVHRRRWWHPVVWWRAAVDAVRTIVNAGDYQIAHPRCAGNDACHIEHGRDE